MTDPGWTWADAWFLEAVHNAGAPGDLEQIIAVADAMNHAILTRAEVEHAVSRLVPAGLLELVDRRYLLTVTGLACPQDRDLHRGAARLSRSHPDLSAKPWRLDPAEHARAVAAYVATFPVRAQPQS